MILKNKSLAILSLLFASQIAACSSSSNSSEPVVTLEWDECTTAAVEYECSTLKVPMDYTNPASEELDIALIRLPATGDERLGSLTFMYGGPAPYVEITPLLLRFGTIPDSIRESYDIVGFDPRGVGDSTNVDCSEFIEDGVHPYPINTEQLTQMHANYTRMADACSAKQGELLQHIGSLNVVKDMDRMRIGLGDAKLNMVSSSFGTLFSALYMQEFPESTGLVVQDASLHPDVRQRNLYINSLASRDAEFLKVLSLCKSAEADCDPQSLLAGLTARANELATEDTEKSRFELLVMERLVSERMLEESGYAEFYLPALIDYINTSETAAIEAAIAEMEDDELFDEAEFDAADIALKCADDGFRPQVADMQADLISFNQQSDYFAENSIPYTSNCAGWPEALAPLSPIVTSTAPLSLVIGGTNDSRTPLSWSEEMATAVGGVVIRSNHDGHGAAFLGKSDCVDDIIATFLLDGMVPATQECI